MPLLRTLTHPFVFGDIMLTGLGTLYRIFLLQSRNQPAGITESDVRRLHAFHNVRPVGTADNATIRYTARSLRGSRTPF